MKKKVVESSFVEEPVEKPRVASVEKLVVTDAVVESAKKEKLSRDALDESVNRYNFDLYYAEAWSRKQGHFSMSLANNLIGFLKAEKIRVKSVLDVCSGSGEFLSVLSNVIPKCVGCDIAESYLNFVKSNHRNIELFKVDNFHTFTYKTKFDFISYNHDVVNMFSNFEEWKKCFKNAYGLLNSGGYLMFDFYTEKKLANWNSTIFEQSDEIDYVSKISNQFGKCIMNEVYYLKQSTSYYRKTSDIMVETYFSNKDILLALKDAGFSKIQPIDKDFNFISMENLGELDRIHLLCKK